MSYLEIVATVGVGWLVFASLKIAGQIDRLDKLLTIHIEKTETALDEFRAFESSLDMTLTHGVLDVKIVKEEED